MKCKHTTKGVGRKIFGGGQQKKDRKIALLSLYLLYYENPGGARPPRLSRCRRSCMQPGIEIFVSAIKEKPAKS